MARARAQQPTKTAETFSNMNSKQVKAAIAALKHREAQLVVEERAAVRKQIQAMLKQAGMTIEEVFPALARGGAKLFRNPQDPHQTWTGRGKRPRWYLEALKAGHSRESLRS